MKPPTCGYCGCPASLVSGDQIFGTGRFSDKLFWLCPTCDAYVGCHHRSQKPLGTLAQRDLRAARKQAHATFDPVWKSGRTSRNAAYAWLAERLEIPLDECHIGMFDEATCRRTIAVCVEEYHNRGVV